MEFRLKLCRILIIESRLRDSETLSVFLHRKTSHRSYVVKHRLRTTICFEKCFKDKSNWPDKPEKLELTATAEAAMPSCLVLAGRLEDFRV
ncbi:hypothetical protein CEXT_426431 [Caerostris extrusa]|uniref:Uncharacterized protein n=1 Tax=Caerostris extrusa TaxID=172846 RepID=A0AAV4Y4I2_CAEEX|nr:hypothetical protein CEXT_426431 [Caerostris extrusa]